MKIELEIPDWAAKSRIVILSGVELVAMKLPWENHWTIKDTRCNQCGLCCHDNPITPYQNDEEGRCEKLHYDRGLWHCTAKASKPYNCILDPPEDFEGCCITHKKIGV